MDLKQTILLFVLLANVLASSAWKTDDDCIGFLSNLPNLVVQASDEKRILMKALYVDCAKVIDGYHPKPIIKLELMKESDIMNVKRNHDTRFHGIPTK